MFTARWKKPTCKNIELTSRHHSPWATPITGPFAVKTPEAKSAPCSKIELFVKEALRPLASSTAATRQFAAINPIVIALMRRAPTPVTAR